MSEKSLHDVYLRPWRAFIRAGGRGMRAAHNDLNGKPMHAGGWTSRGGVFQQLFREPSKRRQTSSGLVPAGGGGGGDAHACS